MKKIYHLSSCNTCQRIISDVDLGEDFIFQDIKKDPITEGQLLDMHRLAGSHEALFSKRARLYKSKGLKDKNLSEGDFKKCILQHYTFLKRPVIIIDENIFIGNSKKTVEAAKAVLND